MPRTNCVATSVATSIATSIAKSTLAGALGAFALVVTACAPAARPGTSALSLAPTGVADLTRSGSHVMTADDFGRAGDAPNALVAIERLRPLFLKPRPSFGSLRGQSPVVSVFINGAYAGGVDALRLVGADAVASARYLQPTEAITTLGARYAADGVIMVQLKGFHR